MEITEVLSQIAAGAADRSQMHERVASVAARQRQRFAEKADTVNPGMRKEASKKLACVQLENNHRQSRGEKPIGYISVVRGATIPEEYFDAALAGKTLPLVEKATPSGNLV